MFSLTNCVTFLVTENCHERDLEVNGSISCQVESMSIELEEAKTKVAQFQKECEEYLVVIVQQKRDADEQQKVQFGFYIYRLVLFFSFYQQIPVTVNSCLLTSQRITNLRFMWHKATRSISIPTGC